MPKLKDYENIWKLRYLGHLFSNGASPGKNFTDGYPTDNRKLIDS